jgi:thiamine kinase-like enzyme
MNNLIEIAGKFNIKGEISEIIPFGSGHIHDTFHVRTETTQTDDYILQRINTNVFSDPEAVMQNIAVVTSHIQKKLMESGTADLKREVLSPVWPRDGKLIHTDKSGSVWRCFVYISGHKTYDKAINENQVYEGGRAFGKFLNFLSDLPLTGMHETIKDFHNIDWRLHQFYDALDKGIPDRIKETHAEINQLTLRKEEMRTIRKLSQEGIIPIRVVHHDTKINNVLYNHDGRALCVIDLDTVMPGYVHDDFGDSIRTFTNTGEEDDIDLNRVGINVDYFKAYATGFFDSARNMLNLQEKQNLALSARIMTYMQSLRFLTDYLNGDVYYHTHLPGQNLQRARAQIKLLMSLEEKDDEMKRIIDKLH